MKCACDIGDSIFAFSSSILWYLLIYRVYNGEIARGHGGVGKRLLKMEKKPCCVVTSRRGDADLLVTF